MPSREIGKIQMLHEFLENFLHNLFKPLLLFFYFGFLIPIFKVDFEFKNRLMGMALNPVFESVCDKIVDAFVIRALKIYG